MHELNFVSAQKGLRMCLMTYVKLLVHLSKLEAIVHGKLRAMPYKCYSHNKVEYSLVMVKVTNVLIVTGSALRFNF